jgi:hypothetical protein
VEYDDAKSWFALSWTDAGSVGRVNLVEENFSAVGETVKEYSVKLLVKKVNIRA